MFIECVFSTKHTVSSANRLIFISSLFTFIPLISLLFLTLFASGSVAKMNKYGEIGHPCRTPFPSLNQLLIFPLFNSVASISVYRSFIASIYAFPKLNASKHLKIYFHFRLSNAFSKSKLIMKPGSSCQLV